MIKIARTVVVSTVAGVLVPLAPAAAVAAPAAGVRLAAPGGGAALLAHRFRLRFPVRVRAAAPAWRHGIVMGGTVGVAIAPPWFFGLTVYRSYAPAVVYGACCHAHAQAPAPPVVAVAPPPAPPTAIAAAAPPPPEEHAVGLLVAGVARGSAGGVPETGVAAGLLLGAGTVFRIGLEGEGLGARRADGTETRHLDGLVTARLYLWDAPLTVFAGAAGGLGRATVRRDADRESATQLVGKVGGGVEIRLGRRLSLDGQLLGVHRARVDRDGDALFAGLGDAPPAIPDRERSVEARAGIVVRI